ncbi:MAG: NERD domain-containing protein [Cyanobacteria bacterium Co-bin13]|nr:NERD domain-containing protein [Cyanobacteria bacterium Co-bin13]
MTIVTLPLIGYSIFKIHRLIKRMRRLKMARDGEKAVGQYLMDLRENGYRIFHDIIGSGLNVDHVIISDRGIFTIETKTYSKPVSGKPTITFDGESIQVDGYTPEHNVVDQAKAQASWIQDILKESTGRQLPVKPVIVFPGWFVEASKTASGSNVWVLNPKALPGFLQHEPACLSPEDVKLAAYHLSRHIRTTK